MTFREYVDQAAVELVQAELNHGPHQDQHTILLRRREPGGYVLGLMHSADDGQTWRLTEYTDPQPL